MENTLNMSPVFPVFVNHLHNEFERMSAEERDSLLQTYSKKAKDQEYSGIMIKTPSNLITPL